MIISKSKNYLFIHIPKTGGSSLRRELIKNKSDEDLVFLDDNQHNKVPSIKKIYTENDINWKSTFKFAFVRNPWDRVVSYYLYQFKNKLSFKQFVKQSKDTQLSYIQDKNGDVDVDFVGQFENYKQDAEFILKKFGMCQEMKTHTNRTYHKHYIEYYTNETRSIVEDNYAKDIEYFGYKYGE